MKAQSSKLKIVRRMAMWPFFLLYGENGERQERKGAKSTNNKQQTTKVTRVLGAFFRDFH
jgi:hypothetical protein